MVVKWLHQPMESAKVFSIKKAVAIAASALVITVSGLAIPVAASADGIGTSPGPERGFVVDHPIFSVENLKTRHQNQPFTPHSIVGR